jgi:4-hydroxy-2-oxoheptanedioate aldolase
MDMPVNAFKRALREGVPQIGLWMGMADAYVAELLATCGFDWICIDGEHSPNDVRSVLAQLQAMAPYPVRSVVRPVQGDPALLKQYLDIGAQTLLIPMVETAEQAAQMVAATRYPPHGIRGVGSALARASRWNQIDGYLQRSDAEMCVVVQIESTNALGNLEAIAAVEGVDGVFFGPADLAASMGLLGKVMDREVQSAVLKGIERVRGAGRAAGVLSGDRQFARDCLAAGASFVAVGVDTTVLVKAAKELLQCFSKPGLSSDAPSWF